MTKFASQKSERVNIDKIENMITKMRKKNKTKNVSENKSSTNCPGGFFNQVSKC